MNQHIKSITVRGLHRTSSYPGSDFEIQFQSGVNVVYGLNGSGKTTLLHILVNAVRFDFYRFAGLYFDEISLEFSNGETLRITHTDRDSHMEISFHGLSVVIDDIHLLEILRLHMNSFEPTHGLAETDAEEAELNVRSGIHRELAIEHHERIRALSLPPNLIELATALQDKLTITAEYFPAFRLISEVIPIFEDESRMRRRQEDARVRRIRVAGRRHGPEFPERAYRDTLVRIHGEFAPELNYLPPSEIEHRLRFEVQRVVANVARSNRETLSDLSFEVLRVSYGTIIGNARDEINTLVSDLQNTPIYPWLPEVATTYRRLNELNKSADDSGQIAPETAELYRRSLDKILKEQEDQYAHIERFKNSVNEFLIGKNLVITPGDDRNLNEIGIQRAGDESLIPLDTMSSGERQIFSLLYASSFMGDANLVLIDEPEISLHIDWQYQFAQTIAQLLGPKQLIVCTHSPEILTGFEEVEGCNSIELDPAPTKVYGRD